MSELDEIRVFVNLVEANSSTKAAAKMGLAVSAISRRMKELESAGAYAAELEVVPHRLASFLSSETSLLLMSLGSA